MDNLSAGGKNTEKYITLSVLIEKEIKKPNMKWRRNYTNQNFQNDIY